MNEQYQYTTTANYNNFDMNNYGDYFDANYDLIANPYAEFTTFYKDDATLNNELFEEESSLFDYNLTTPLRINGGATFFISKNGFITADITYLDYSSMKLDGKNGSLESENNDIKDLYNSVLSYRVGGEFRMKAFRLRAGYNYQPSPYKESDIDRKVQTFSAGFGFRSSKYFVDLAASYKQYNSIYSPYVLDNPNDLPEYQTNYVDIENSNLNIVLSIGLFF